MKRSYVKPVLVKSSVKLQTVTADLIYYSVMKP